MGSDCPIVFTKKVKGTLSTLLPDSLQSEQLWMRLSLKVTSIKERRRRGMAFDC
jgi:hypothetical protein